MSTSSDDGHETRAHLEKAVEMGALPASVLEGPSCPDVLWYLWEYFTELTLARDYGMGGAGSISWTEVMSWAQLTRRCILPYEAQALIQMDTVYRGEMSKSMRDKAKRAGAKR